MHRNHVTACMHIILVQILVMPSSDDAAMENVRAIQHSSLGKVMLDMSTSLADTLQPRIPSF